MAGATDGFKLLAGIRLEFGAMVLILSDTWPI